MTGVVMWTLRRCVVLGFFVMPLIQTAWAVDELYRCTDGTFTNRVELQCAPYESKGTVRVQGNTIDKEEAQKAAFAEVKVVEEPMKHRAADPHR